MPEERTTSSTGGQKGVKLARFDLIPAGPLLRLAEHFGKGAKKYAEHQWREGYEWSKGYAAIERHLNAFWSGLDYDVCSNEPDNCALKTDDGQVIEYHHERATFRNREPGMDIVIEDLAGRRLVFPFPYEYDTCYNHTGSHHLDCVMWHSFVLREFVEVFPNFDDRYIPGRVPRGFLKLPNQEPKSAEEIREILLGPNNPIILPTEEDPA